MGRIKNAQIKRVTHKLVELYGERLTADFSHNKVAVGELAEIRSKKLRNVIAGYAVRLKKERKVGLLFL